MILGRGIALTDEQVIAEYHQLLEATGVGKHPTVFRNYHNAPLWMKQVIGKPILQWKDTDLLALYHPEPTKWKKAAYNCFLAFLLFRGYLRASISLLVETRIQLAVQFRPALAPYRERLCLAQKAMGYQYKSQGAKSDGVGSVLEMYLWFLSTTGKLAEEVTREDFDSFKEAYDSWYRKAGIRHDGRPNTHLFRLEQLLVYLHFIPAKMGIYEPAHERYFLEFPHSPIREAILQYLNWYTVKYTFRSASAQRMSLSYFFKWLCEHYPHCTTPRAVTRPIAMEYASYVKKLGLSAIYQRQIYQGVYALFEFAIEERLEASPDRNPFTRGDLPRLPNMVPRYIPDQELRTILKYCEQDATLLERTLTLTLLHTGIRASELAALKVSDIVQIAGVWKLHIHEGKGLKDRVIPLTEKCVTVLQEWMASGWKRTNDHLFTHYGRPRTNGHHVADVIRTMAQKIGLTGISPHRFRHTFAVALLNYGVRESALQKLMGHATLGMTLEYARILDETVERSFTEAISQMEEGANSWVPNFFVQEDYTLFAEGDAVSWIQLPVGFCRRNPKLHCESDVKCLLCERFCATPKDLPRLQQMYERFTKLGLKLKAEVVSAQIQQLQALPHGASVLIPTNAISVASKRTERH